jgi:hypothetical protein
VQVPEGPLLLVHVVAVRAGCEDSGIEAAAAVKLGISRLEIVVVDPVDLEDDMHRWTSGASQCTHKKRC